MSEEMRRQLRLAGYVVLRTPTTAARLERDLAASTAAVSMAYLWRDRTFDVKCIPWRVRRCQ